MIGLTTNAEDEMHHDAASTAAVKQTTGLPDQDRGSWTSVAALGIGTFAIGTDMFVVAGVLGGLAGDLDVTVGAAGLAVTVFGLAYATGAALPSALLGGRPLPQVLIAVLSLGAATVAGALTVVVGWGIAAWGFVPAQQHRLVGPCSSPAPWRLALNSSAIHLGLATGARMGGLVVDAAGVSPLWMLVVACCGAGLILHEILTREVQP